MEGHTTDISFKRSLGQVMGIDENIVEAEDGDENYWDD